MLRTSCMHHALRQPGPKTCLSRSSSFGNAQMSWGEAEEHRSQCSFAAHKDHTRWQFAVEGISVINKSTNTHVTHPDSVCLQCRARGYTVTCWHLRHGCECDKKEREWNEREQ